MLDQIFNEGIHECYTFTDLSIQSRYMIPQSYSIFQRQWWKMRHDIAAHNYRNYFPSLFLVTPCGTLKTPSIWRLNTFIKKKRENFVVLLPFKRRRRRERACEKKKFKNKIGENKDLWDFKWG